MRSMTAGAPKELLPLSGHVVLWNVVEEARAAGATAVTIVSSPVKPELDQWASEHGDVLLAHQLEQRGLAHAIAAALPVEGVVLVLLPDTVFHPVSPCPRLVAALATADAVVATEEVSDSQVRLYGIVESQGGIVSSILEKPMPDQTESRRAVAARYGLGPRMLEILIEAVESFHGEGEIGLTEVLNRGISAGLRVVETSVPPGSTRLDCGSPEGYREALAILGP